MRRRLLLLVGVLVVIWALVAALWLVRIGSDLRAGRAAASTARDHLGAEQVAKQEPLPQLRLAARRFHAAHDRASGPVLLPLQVLPVVGRQLRSVSSLSRAAAGVADAGVVAVERAGKVFDHPAGAGATRVRQVRELSEIVDDVAARLAAIDDLGPVRGLVSPLADARNELASDLADARHSIDAAQTGARAALSLVRGPRRYLVLAANNAEMRAGSGMWLQGGVLETRDGALHLDEMVSLHLDAQPPPGAATPTGDLASRWGFLRPGEEWRNLMASPQFVSSAKLAAQMWKAAGRGDVDGVLSVDAIGLRAIVEATGPVVVDDRTITAEDVAPQILHDQYLAYGDISSQQGQNNAERRETLAALASSAVKAIDHGDYPASTLIRTLGDAIAGRHLLAWSTNEVEEAGWEAGGMNGALERDSLLVSILNRGGNKLDWFLRVGATLDVKKVGAHWEASLALRLRNPTPAGEPRYIAGPYPGLELDAGEYRGIVAVNIPGDARHAHFDGVDKLAVAGADGPTRVVGFQLDLPRGAERTVVLRFELPDSADHVEILPSARVPAISWHYGSSAWQDTASRTAKW
jgi:hypothetical protein